jgi:hypothetical protein
MDKRQHCSFRVLALVAIASLNPLANDQTAQDWQAQYSDLQQQIDAGGLGKSTPVTNQPVVDVNALVLPHDRTPTDVVLRRTEALLRSFARMRRAPARLAEFAPQIDELKRAALISGQGLGKSAATSDKELFMQARGLQRAVALSNPLLDFDTILFVQHNPGGGQDHMIDQYMGNNVNSGGGLYMVTGFRAGGVSTARIIDILANATVTNGRFAGRKLSTGSYSFLSPDLSYDGKTIVFSWTNDWCYHIFKVNTNGTNLVQLTDGTASYNQSNRSMNASQNEFDPCWLPNGRIVFISERRGGYGRCHTWEKPTWTLYSMKDDGTDIIPISYHETNEWQPSVNNDGMLAYTRWDYLDRDDCIAHHLWTCYPDGRDPRAPHGNYPLALTTMTGSNWPDGRSFRPNGEWNIRAIPNTQKYVATAANHHSKSYGQLVIIDPSIPDDGRMSQVKGITSTSSTNWDDWGSDAYGGGMGPYGTAWPLSEEYFLCNKMNTIILRDIFGNEDVLCSVAGTARLLDPIPLRPRQKPPVLATATWQGARASLPDHKRATISIMNVNYGDLPLPAGTKITAIRILQIIPKATPNIDDPRICYAAEALARLSLGTAPVESDGSAYFEAPVAKEIYFQLIDNKGMAVQSMRAGTYVHPGEQMTCYGCHEDKWKATPTLPATPLAQRRTPSKLAPEPGAETGGATPINYYRLVKPVFDRACVPCHQQKSVAPATMSYSSLEQYAFYFCGPGNPFIDGDITTAIRGGSRTMPGMVGARYSSMGKALLNATHQTAGISNDDFRRVCLWLDGNSNELSAYTRVTDQKAGTLVWPELDFDSANPTGVEAGFPSPTEPSLAGYRFKSVSKYTATLFLKQGYNLAIPNPCAGNVQVRLLDPAGRTIAQRMSSEARIVMDPPPSRGCYVVEIHGPDGRLAKKMLLIVA